MLDNELMLRRELEVVASDQLRTILQSEMAKDIPDDDLVLTILHILEDREPDDLAPASAREEAAWKLFRKRVRSRKRKLRFTGRNLANAAVLLLVVCLLVAAIPNQAQADSWWDRIARWTDDFFGFFREEEDSFNLEDYEFRTDNPGLQQVYDAVVELGVTEPVVPMWLPEGYELVDIIVDTMLNKKTAVAWFEDADKIIIYRIAVLSTDKSEEYHKEDTQIITHEMYNTVYNIMPNNDVWLIAWTKNNIECSIAMDCQEDVLYEIIDSIYRWRMIE